MTILSKHDKSKYFVLNIKYSVANKFYVISFKGNPTKVQMFQL